VHGLTLQEGQAWNAIFLFDAPEAQSFELCPLCLRSSPRPEEINRNPE
jgi:hypothetical protein